MSDQSYADSGGVQIFHAGTPNDILVPEVDLTATGSPNGTRLLTAVAGTNRYTVTSVGMAFTEALVGARSLIGQVIPVGGGTALNTFYFDLAEGGLSSGSVLRRAISIDVLPGQAFLIGTSSGNASAGAGVILIEGYSSGFGPVEPGSSIPLPAPNPASPAKILFNGVASDQRDQPVVRSEPLIGQSE